MKILVQKFGGTSVATDERRNMVIDKIESALERGYFPVIVVSAIGRKGDPYATDTLLSLLNDNSIGQIKPREMDLLMSCGEIISCTLITSMINQKGYQAVALTGGQAGIITDNNYGDAEIIRVEKANIIKYVENGIIPVIAGFQGITEDGNITTLGRGGSDVTGSILGEALNAEAVEIYTDVEGVMTADPRIVPDAAIIDRIFFNEVFQMAEYGAKVIHPRAVEIAMRSNIPLYIKNTMSDSEGTLITNCDRTRNYRIDKSDKMITAIANISSRTQFKVRFNGNNLECENDYMLFSAIANAKISIDMINIYPKTKVFIVDDSNCEKMRSILESNNYTYEMVRDCCKVTLIGNRMRGVPGVMAKVIHALSKESIELIQTSDSHTTISCLLKSDNMKKAVIALHDEFKLGNNI